MFLLIKQVWDLLANQQTKLCFHHGCPALSLLRSLSMCCSHVFFHSYLAPGTPPLRFSVTLSSHVQAHPNPVVQFVGPSAYFPPCRQHDEKRRTTLAPDALALTLMLMPPFLPGVTSQQNKKTDSTVTESDSHIIHILHCAATLCHQRYNTFFI